MFCGSISIRMEPTGEKKKLDGTVSNEIEKAGKSWSTIKKKDWQQIEFDFGTLRSPRGVAKLKKNNQKKYTFLVLNYGHLFCHSAELIMLLLSILLDDNNCCHSAIS